MPTSTPATTAPSVSSPRYIQSDHTARRAHAYYAGESKARRREVSADAYLFLYKELVGLAGERTYCWPGIDYLMTTLGVSEGTIKRWMRELEHAALIKRKPRPGGQTSLTYIVAYLRADESPRTSQGDASATDDLRDVLQWSDRALAKERTPEVDASAQHLDESRVLDTERPALFFGPLQEIDPDPGAGSEMISPTFKEQDLNDLGGGGRPGPANVGDSDDHVISALLESEGVVSYAVIDEIKEHSPSELHAIAKYVDRQKNVVSPAGLFVWLARQGFGSALLSGRHQRQCKERKPRRTSTTVDAAHKRAPLPPPRALPLQLTQLWERTRGELRDHVSPTEWTTWLEPLALLDCEEDVLVLAAPNVFVRDRVRDTFAAMIADRLSSRRGTATDVEVVIAPLV